MVCSGRAGIRTPSTMRSNDAWLAAHRSGGYPECVDDVR
ncbi:SdpI family protein [Cellulomonas sp.]